ncbi:hypothetical protein F2Q69_00023117 [Brassica cretica]|uniref:Uncharacterized protein n=1 Tax=Brassica cretica TaxID=69181 RepID=A0A8S9QCL1_BRACR|nr:hypothetical protein F2Q69_00023117 [Brassica cretica]
MMAFMGDCAHADLLVPPIEGRIHELWDPIPVSPAGLACRSRLTRRKPRRTLRAKAGKWIRLRAPFERPCREISCLRVHIGLYGFALYESSYSQRLSEILLQNVLISRSGPIDRLRATVSGSAAVSGVVSSVGEGALDLETCLSSAVIASADGFELSLT